MQQQVKLWLMLKKQLIFRLMAPTHESHSRPSFPCFKMSPANPSEILLMTLWRVLNILIRYVEIIFMEEASGASEN